MELRLGGARLILDEVEGSTTLDCRESGPKGYGLPRTGRTVGIVSNSTHSALNRHGVKMEPQMNADRR